MIFSTSEQSTNINDVLIKLKGKKQIAKYSKVIKRGTFVQFLAIWVASKTIKARREDAMYTSVSNFSAGKY